ncbi:MAG TPA: phage holin family protein [Acidimicrobiales bacterium]|nr:phage holin family protein [Acidimicrobiales bacterium]
MTAPTSRPTASTARSGAQSVPELASELWQLTVDYAKQETIDPLKGLGRFIGFGLAGALALGIGVTLLMLAGLRALQTETGSAFTGNLSWIPYLIVVAVGVALIALAVARVNRRRGPGA